MACATPAVRSSRPTTVRGGPLWHSMLSTLWCLPGELVYCSGRFSDEEFVEEGGRFDGLRCALLEYRQCLHDRGRAGIFLRIFNRSFAGHPVDAGGLDHRRQLCLCADRRAVECTVRPVDRQDSARRHEKFAAGTGFVRHDHQHSDIVDRRDDRAGGARIGPRAHLAKRIDAADGHAWLGADPFPVAGVHSHAGIFAADIVDHLHRPFQCARTHRGQTCRAGGRGRRGGSAAVAGPGGRAVRADFSLHARTAPAMESRIGRRPDDGCAIRRRPLGRRSISGAFHATQRVRCRSLVCGVVAVAVLHRPDFLFGAEFTACLGGLREPGLDGKEQRAGSNQRDAAGGLQVNGSPRNSTAQITTKTTLSLSMGATREAGASCKAR